MNRLLILTGATVAALAIAIPAVAGLADNPTFSHRVPVRVPAQAQLVIFDDRGHAVDHRAATTPATRSSSPSAVRTSEPGDDGHRRGADPTAASPSAGATNEDRDDRGGDDSATASPETSPATGAASDDNRHRDGAGTTTAAPSARATTEDHGQGGHGSPMSSSTNSGGDHSGADNNGQGKGGNSK